MAKRNDLLELLNQALEGRKDAELGYFRMKDAVRAQNRGVRNLSGKYGRLKDRMRQADLLVADLLVWMVSTDNGTKGHWEQLVLRCRAHLGTDRKKPEKKSEEEALL